MSKQAVYLDYHSSTPVDPEVLEVMQKYFVSEFGNSSSRSHKWGWDSSKAIERARKQVATLFGAPPQDIVFTSGGTEANNLALLGLWETYGGRGKNIICSSVEHSSVIGPCTHLESKGAELRIAPVDEKGRIKIEELENLIDKNTVFVSVIYANNEVGTIQDLKTLSRLAHDKGAFFHTDAVQAFGKFPIDVKDLDVDLLSLSSHKLYGPKGAGALYVARRKPRIKLSPLFYGGGHEKGLRAGTLNTPALVGLGEASNVAREKMTVDREHCSTLRESFYKKLEQGIPGLKRNGDLENQTSQNLSLTFPEGSDLRALMAGVPEVAFSTGSACASSNPQPSPILMAMGLSASEALRTARFGFGRFTTPEEVDFAAKKMLEWWKRQRS